MSRSGKSDPRALEDELDDDSRANGLQKRKQKKKGKKGGRAYDDDDDLDGELDGTTPSLGVAEADADEAMDTSTAKKNIKKKGGAKKGAFALLDEDVSDSEASPAPQEVEKDEAEDEESLMFAGKKKGKKGKKDKKSSMDDYPVLDPDAEAEAEEAIDFSAAKKKNNKKKGGAKKTAFTLLDEDMSDNETASVSQSVDEAKQDEADEEETLMFAGKKKGKKDKKPSMDDYPVLDPDAEAEEAIDFSASKKKNNKKNGGAKKTAFSVLDEDMSENEVASVSQAVDEGEQDGAEEEETLMFAGKKKGKKGKKDKKASIDDYPELDPDAEAEEAVDFSAKSKNNKDNKKKGGAKKTAFDLLDEDMSDNEVASVSQAAPSVDEAEQDEAEEEETLMFAGKKKGKKGKKDKKPSKDDEGMDSLIEELEGHKITEAATPVPVAAEPKGKQKKKGKKSGRTIQEEEDLDAILAELEGPSRPTPPAAEAVPPAPVSAAPAAAEEPSSVEKSLSGGAVVPDGEEVTESAASKKKKKKKEKEKAAKAGAADKPAEEIVVEEKKAPVKVEETKGKASDKKVPKHVREMQERLARMKEAEERRIQEEEEKRRKEEEEQRRQEELEREKEEIKRRRKEREKEKLLQKKKDGKLLTGKKKEEARRLAIMREQFGITTDLESPTGEEISTPRKPKYETKKKKKPPGAGQAVEAASVVAEEAEMIKPPVAEPEPEPEPELEPEPEPEPVPATPMEVEEEEEEEDWDAKSFEEVNLPAIKSAFAEEEADDGPVKAGQVTVPPPSAPPAITKPSSPKKKPAPPSRPQQKAVENEDEDEEDEEDEDDEDDDSEDETDTRKLQQAKLSRERRREEALKKRSAEDLRSPICCILGHVDTGKTKLLDCIRRTNVQEGEAGGITQQIGATYFPMENIKERTKELKSDAKLRVPGLLVIDTPGHESFTNLRARGSSLCDIAILVIDIMHGLEPQTIESLNLLKARRTPFVIALNKVDRLYGWKTCPNAPIRNAFKLQSKDVLGEFEQRVSQISTQLKEQGLNSELYYKNKELRKVISIIPTSAISGEGVPDILMLLVQLTQKLMEDKLMYISEVQATVLEVKVVEGLGTTIDVVLVNGVLHEGDQIVVCGMQGPIVTNIRALLTPHPMKELRVKGSYQHHKELKAAQGIKITAQGLEHAIAGTQLYVVGPEDDIDDIKDEAMQDIKNVFSRVDKSGEGVCVQASTLGSLEALLEFLKSPAVKIPVSVINIGPVHKKDVMRASVMLERKRKEFATILAFDVKVTTEAKELAEEVGVRIFTADIIYHLFDQFTAYMNSVKEEKRKDASEEAVFPCVMKIMPQCVFNKKDPIIVGVEILDGVAKVGTPLCIPSRDGIDIGKIASMEINHKVVDTAKKGQTVAMKIVGTNAEENARMFGRHFDMEDEFVSRISRRSIDLLKENYRDDLTTEEWRLVVKLKKLFEIP